MALVGCGGDAGDEPLPEPCAPVPAGFIAWRSGDLVQVSKPLNRTASGVQLHAEIRSVYAADLPERVDFGAEVIEVREDMTLCLAPPDAA